MRLKQLDGEKAKKKTSGRMHGITCEIGFSVEGLLNLRLKQFVSAFLLSSCQDLDFLRQKSE